MSLLTPDTGLLFWMLLSFGVVFFLLAKYGFPVITRMVEERKSYIDHSLEAAREANLKLDQVKAEIDLMLAKAQEEKIHLLNEAVATRNKIIKEAQQQAESDSKRQLDEARKQIEAEKKELIRDARRQVAVLSVNIAEKVFRKSLKDEKEQMELIDRLLDDVTYKS